MPAISVGIFFAIAFVLILSQPPKGFVSAETLDFPEGDSGAPVSELMTFTARDGATLGYRDIAGTGSGDMILVHGSVWHGAAYEPLAQAISQRCGYRVIVPDLRGHGPLADPRGDIAYVEDLEEGPGVLVDALEGLEAEHDGVEEDHREHDRLEAVRCGEPAAEGDHDGRESCHAGRGAVRAARRVACPSCPGPSSSPASESATTS